MSKVSSSGTSIFRGGINKNTWPILNLHTGLLACRGGKVWDNKKKWSKICTPKQKCRLWEFLDADVAEEVRTSPWMLKTCAAALQGSVREKGLGWRGLIWVREKELWLDPPFLMLSIRELTCLQMLRKRSLPFLFQRRQPETPPVKSRLDWEVTTNAAAVEQPNGCCENSRLWWKTVQCAYDRDSS